VATASATSNAPTRHPAKRRGAPALIPESVAAWSALAMIAVMSVSKSCEAAKNENRPERALCVPAGRMEVGVAAYQSL
jgi:hypothetical protein